MTLVMWYECCSGTLYEAEFWDMSGPKGIRYLFEAARALFSGERMQGGAGAETHDRIELGDGPARD